MTYKQLHTSLATKHAKKYSKAVFIGYNTVYGSRMYGTLNGVPTKQCIEMPVAENLMMGMAMGMSLEGYRPVVCFERHDFLLLALDALVNHVDKMPWMSEGQYKFPILIRAIVGGTRPLNAGPQHTQIYTSQLGTMLKHTPVINGISRQDIELAWNTVGRTNSGAVVLTEYRDFYDMDVIEESISMRFPTLKELDFEG